MTNDTLIIIINCSLICAWVSIFYLHKRIDFWVEMNKAHTSALEELYYDLTGKYRELKVKVRQLESLHKNTHMDDTTNQGKEPQDDRLRKD